MRKAYSYIRFSTPDQRRGDSFRRQSEFAGRYCEKNGLTLDTSLKLSDLGVSAFKGNNVKFGALAGFLRAVESGLVPKGSVLILESLDRLSRDQLDPAGELLRGILRAGVNVVTVNPEREYTSASLNDLIGVIEPLLYLFRAHEESATKSKRVAESWRSRRKAAAETAAPMTSVGPKWLGQKDGKWEPIPERVKVVQSIFRWSGEGLGTYAIAKKLNQQKTPAFGRSGKWNVAYVRLILTDRRAMGEYQPKKLVAGKMQPEGEPIPSYFPPAVGADDFYAAAGQIKGRKRRAGRGGAGRENVLSGRVFNARDRSKMYFGVDGRGKPLLDTASPYYGGKATEGRSCPYKPVEQGVLTVLKERAAKCLTPNQKALDGLPEKLASLKGRIGEVEAQQAKVNQRIAAASGADFDILLDTVEALGRERKRLLAEAEAAKVEMAKGSSPTLEQVAGWITLREAAAGEERERINRRLRAAVEEYVESVWLYVVPITRNKKVVHMQVYLNDGGREYLMVFHPAQPPAEELIKYPSYRDVDFKTWSDPESGKPASRKGRSGGTRR